MIIYNTGAKHLAEKIDLPKIDFNINHFPDGEINIKINQSLLPQEVWVIASTQPPSENLVELLFILDSLKRAGAKNINLLFTYFGYARSSTVINGQSNNAQFICDILKKFDLNKIYIINVHASQTLNDFIEFQNVIDFNFYYEIAKNYDVIASPDKGAAQLATKIAQDCLKELIILEKERQSPEQVNIKATCTTKVHGKTVLLVDDLICTGNTIIEATQLIKNLGVAGISAAVTHGVFASSALEKLKKNENIKNIYVTNTLQQTSTDKIKATDISGFIKSIIMGLK